MANAPNFPFTILDVITCLGLPIRKVNRDVVYIDCPECSYNAHNGHSGKGRCECNVTSGTYNCCRCGQFGGGMLDLYCYYKNVDYKTANREIRAFINNDTYTHTRDKTKKLLQQTQKHENVNLAKKNEIDKTYRAFLSLCKLREEHKNNLLKRGLSENNIAHFGFKSTPVDYFEKQKIIAELQKRGCRLEGVPGFYINDKGKWDILLYPKISGFFIPMCNLKNQCLGMQIRLDVPTDTKKYQWLSSKNCDHGCGRTSIPHITNTHNIGETVYLTEGGLKADVAHVLGNRTFIAVAGVTQFKIMPLLFNQLKKSGVKRIVDTYDADCKYNENVEKARNKLKQIVIKSGLDYCRIDWDLGKNNVDKGIDDYLLHHPKGSRKFLIFE